MTQMIIIDISAKRPRIFAQVPGAAGKITFSQRLSARRRNSRNLVQSQGTD